MPLLDDDLTLWEIGFRWADKNPGQPWLRIPLEVKDNFRLVVRAIADGDLYCGTLTTKPDEHWSKGALGHYAEVINACINGQHYDRTFLKQHAILRWEFAQWCDKKGNAFPEFWFPGGWTTDEPGYPSSLRKRAAEIVLTSTERKVPPPAPVLVTAPVAELEKTHRNNDAIWLAIETTAKAIWAESGPIPSAEVARRIRAMTVFGATRFTVEVIRKRIAKLAPLEIRGKAGRPPKKKSA